jgi:hypothetical protein
VGILEQRAAVLDGLTARFTCQNTRGALAESFLKRLRSERAEGRIEITLRFLTPGPSVLHLEAAAEVILSILEHALGGKRVLLLGSREVLVEQVAQVRRRQAAFAVAVALSAARRLRRRR